MSKSYCWLKVQIGDRISRETVIVELFDDITPKTCQNFRQLCLGNDGKVVEGSQISMTYRSCTFHRVIPGFMIQGGDFTNHNGTGGVSIYGDKFDDENFTVPCDKPGLLAMANAGANTNGSQFFITTAPAPHLTGKHVVFGRVVRGMNTVRAVEHTPTGANDKPVNACQIVDCGVMSELPEVAPAADGDAFPDYPEDAESVLSGEELLQAGEAIRQVGNGHFKTGAYEEAMEKYAKAIRFIREAESLKVNAEATKEKLVACHSNTSMCALKLGRFGQARQAATEALRLDENNSKALFRRASACLSSGDAEGALEDLKQAQRLDPGNAEIAAKLNEAKELEKRQKSKLAAGLKKMFN